MKLSRWVGYMAYAVNRDPKKRLLKPEELYLLPEIEGTENKKLNIPTKAQMEEMGSLPPPRKLDDTTIDEVILKEKLKPKR